MKLKLLYTLALLLCMSTFATSNECSRHCHQRTAAIASESVPASVLPASVVPASVRPASADPAAPDAEPPAGTGKAYSLTLIKLLYI